MSTTRRHRGIWLRVLSLVAVAFGLLTLKEGGMTLAGNAEALEAAGHYVPFVLWFNFLAGFAYVIAGIGLWLQQRWATRLAVAISVATAITFAAFGAYVYFGGTYEPRTVVAMTLRTLTWIVIAAVSWRLTAAHRAAVGTP